MYIPKTQFSNSPNLRYGKNFVGNDVNLAHHYENGDSNWHSEEGGVQFRPNNNNHHHDSMESDNSGVNSPPLWKNSPIPSPPKSPSYPLLSHHNYRGLSPNSRTQAIARGQWELMEMVKNMPESSYELSLKDLVEHHRVDTLDKRAEEKNPDQNLHQRGVVKERRKNDRNFVRRESFENKGLFLNMVFPFSWKTKKKKGVGSSSSTSGKVSPKPEGVKAGGGGGGGGEKDWWKKKLGGSSDSDSSRMSNNSGSSGSTGSSGGGGGSGSSSGGSYKGGRKRNGFISGCWPCFKSRKSKSVVE